MGIRIGIVGLPNVGKSTLFNALTAARVPAENYPFCTIDRNVGVVHLPDSRLDAIAAIAKPREVVPTAIEFVDIAGLVAGASHGEGLGNRFLAHIRETDAIAHIVRCFDSTDVAHVTGAVDPVADIEIVNTELALADLETVDKALDRYARRGRAGDKEAAAVTATLERVEAHLATGAPMRSLDLRAADLHHLRELSLLTIKPMMYIANVDEDHAGGGALAERVEEYAGRDGSDTVVICAAIEGEIAQLDPEDRAEFLADLGQDEPGLHRVIHAGYHLLDLETFFTANEQAATAWTFERGSTAYEVAGLIHTDFQTGFIRAEVVTHEDYVRYGGEHGAREAGHWRLEGRDHVIHDGDVVYFRFNV